ncbi:hypothetical protein [Microcoleus sp. herbarium2]|uniref:hypothetical protein n=1 Tax=Microcoleus sp. herbarium2 TaxID=3055433 RepID=UPI002FCFDD1A
MSNSSATPVLSPANVPEWHYDSEINLVDYINAHPHQHVFRLFADTISIDKDLTVNANIAQLPLDIRIDCNTLHLALVAAPVAPLVGRSGIISLDGQNACDWKSFALSGDGMTGEQGFPGGNVDIRALNVTSDPAVAAVGFKLSGGNGGAGQQGSWGADGSSGDQGSEGSADIENAENDPPFPDGTTIAIANPTGRASGSGTNGADGGKGGTGGAGGSCGNFNLVVGAAVQVERGTPGVLEGDVTVGQGTSVAFGLNQFPGSGGAGGASGRGGIGGIGGPPHQIWNPQCDPRGTFAGNDYLINAPAGSDGTAGNVGTAGQHGVSGGSGTCNFSGVSTLAALQAMDQDVRPNSLMLRMHQAITTEFSKLAAGGDILDTRKRLAWIAAAAAPNILDYPDVLSRLSQLYSFNDLAASPTLLTAQTAVIPRAALTHMFDRLSASKTPSNNASIWNSITLGSQDVVQSWWDGFNTMKGDSSFDTGTADFGSGIENWIQAQQVRSEVEMVPLNTIIGDNAACVGPDIAEGSTQLDTTIIDLVADDPDLVAGVIAGSAAIWALQNIFSFGLGFAIDGSMQKYLAAVATWESDFNKWEQQEAERATMDAANAPRVADEARRQQRRNDWDKERLFDPLLGQFVAILDSLDVVDGDPTQQVAVFDGIWVPAITDPTLAATYVATVSRRLGLIYTINLPSSVPLTEGNWYVLQLDLLNAVIAPSPFGSASVIESFIQTLDLSATYSLWGLPAIQVNLVGTPITLDSAIQTALIAFLGLVQVPLPIKKTEFEVPNVAIAITNVLVADVGQGACHTVEGDNGFRALLDAGYGDHYDPAKLATLCAWITAQPLYIFLSHWDKDHYMLATKAPTTSLARQPWLAPSFGIRTKTALLLANTIVTNNTKLYLAGTVVPTSIAVSSNIFGVSNAQQLIVAAGLTITNLLLDLTTATTQDKNNSWAMAMAVSQRAATLWQFLIPGDASYRYIPSRLQQNLIALEATHHGSQRSLQGDTIPTFAGGSAGGALYFSNGKNNRHHHSAATVAANYRSKNWLTIYETSSSGQSFILGVPVSEIIEVPIFQRQIGQGEKDVLAGSEESVEINRWPEIKTTRLRCINKAVNWANAYWMSVKNFFK